MYTVDNFSELRESLSPGIYRTRDNRFFAGIAKSRTGYCLQYLSPDGRQEYTRIYVNNVIHAQQMVDMILWAENEGSRG